MAIIQEDLNKEWEEKKKQMEEELDAKRVCYLFTQISYLLQAKRAAKRLSRNNRIKRARENEKLAKAAQSSTASQAADPQTESEPSDDQPILKDKIKT